MPSAVAHESQRETITDVVYPDLHRHLAHRSLPQCPSEDGFAAVVIDADGTVIATAIAVMDDNENLEGGRGIFCCEPNPPLKAYIIIYHYPRPNSAICDGIQENVKICMRCGAIWPGTPVSIGAHWKGDVATACPY